MIHTIAHNFEIDSSDEITIDLLTEYFNDNQNDEALLSLLLVDLDFLGPNTETEGTIQIESIESGNHGIYHLNYLLPYFAFNGCKDMDVHDDYLVTVNFTIDNENIYFDIIETKKTIWHDEI